MRVRSAATLVELLIVIGILGLILGLSFPAVQKVRSAASRTQCANRMTKIGVALHLFHVEQRRFPPGCSYQAGKDPFPHLSWNTRLLPFLDQPGLWTEVEEAFKKESFFLRRPPHVGDRAMPIFLCPADGREIRTYGGRTRAGYGFYLGVEGTNQLTFDGLLFLDSKVRLAEITDGTSTTVMVGERPPSADGSLGWWYAGWGQAKDGSAEMILGIREVPVHGSFLACPPRSNVYKQGSRVNQCDALHFWSMHPNGAHFLFADGSVRFLTYSADNILPALATRAGGEAVAVPD